MLKIYHKTNGCTQYKKCQYFNHQKNMARAINVTQGDDRKKKTKFNPKRPI